MPNNGWIEKVLKSFGYGKGVEALYKPETYEPVDGVKAISGFELEIGLPKIVAIPPKSVEIPSSTSNGYSDRRPVMSRIDNKKLNILEDQLKEILKTLKSMTDFNESVKIEIQEITESISHMERSIGELDDIREGYSSVEKNLRELSVLYDLVSAQFNPFIDTEFLDENIPKGGLSVLAEKTDDKTFLNDYWTLKWIEYLGEKTKQNQIPNLLSYYKKIGRASSAGSIFYAGKLKKLLIALKRIGRKKRHGQQAIMPCKSRVTVSVSFTILLCSFQKPYKKIIAARIEKHKKSIVII